MSVVTLKGDQMADEIKTPPSEEIEIAFDGPAPMANRFYITMMQTVARIAFCEQSPDGTLPRFRSAVSMTVNDMVELNALLTQLIANTSQVAVPAAPQSLNQ